MSLARRNHALRKLIGLGVALLILSIGLWFVVGRPPKPIGSHDSLRVMTYSSFMNAWGPGPEIAKRFRDKTGISIEFQDGGDAGLILQKLKLFPVDVVLGLDGLSLSKAKETLKWQSDFIAIDYAPLAFVYRKKEIDPPTSLRDLLSPRFAGQIALEDPRTSTPGLQFFLWVLDDMGETQGFEFLKQLKKNIHSVSPSWSTAYGVFKKGQAKLAFSYLTSPVYHVTEEKDDSYAAAVFSDGHPVQTEYAGVPGDCARCADADKFIEFLKSEEIQSLIMKRNFMLPIDKDAIAETAFANLPEIKIRDLKSAPNFLKHQDELFSKWQKLGL